MTCFNSTFNYNYTANFFTTSIQVGAVGSWSTGSYYLVTTDSASGTSVVQFTGGTPCGDKPDRSMNVTVSCGATEALTCSEPSTCVYSMNWATPLLCARE